MTGLRLMTEHELFILIEDTKASALSAIRRYLPVEMYFAIDDVVQETYLRVYRSAGSLKFKDENSRNNWIYTIAKHEALRMKRKDSRERDKITRLMNQERVSAPVIELIEDDIEFLRGVISLLPEKYRTIFEMLVAGFSEKEVAEKLAIRHGTVKSRIHRGRELIHRNISQRRGDDAGIYRKKI